MTLEFPAGFLWGAATAAYQIEGAAREAGRGPSIWDTFAHIPGKVFNGDTGDIACDHYHRVAEDVALMKTLGLQAYRFSIAWSRIIPSGRRTDAVNPAGMAFYSDLVDRLLAAGITPFVTLYHWDLPQGLQDDGGWLQRSTTDDYLHYVDVISRALGDRVKHWTTFNEPLCIAYLGHLYGVHAPGNVDFSYREANIVSHHLNLAHGKAVQALRANVPNAQIGMVLNVWPSHPATDSEADRAAALRNDGKEVRWFADPIFKGAYPADRLALFPPESQPPVQPGDMEIVAAPLDYLGVNYYTRAVVVHEPSDFDVTHSRGIEVPDAEMTDMGWEVYPDGLREILVRLHRDYAPKSIYVTENGCAVPDDVQGDQVHDPRRVAYLEGHLRAVHQAIQEGAPIKGYFVWSLMDNFEWAYGYSKRFGITHIDYTTQRRLPKDSFYRYQQVIRAHGV